MSKPKSRRRMLLPALLATTLSSGAGVGGYLLYAPGSSDLSQATQQDLEAGFASAQDDSAPNDTLDGLASAWKREAPGTVVPASAEEPIAAVPDLSAPPISPPGDRYANAPLPIPADLPALPPVEESTEPAPAEMLAGAEPTAESQAIADVPRDAEQVVARGQSPFGDLPPVAPMPAANPLRASSIPTDDSVSAAPVNNQAARTAFEEPAPMPMATEAADNYRALPAVAPAALPVAQPMGHPGANPLRAPAAAMPLESTAPVDSYRQPAPLGPGDPEDRYAQQPAPIESIEADSMPLEQPEAARNAFAQPEPYGAAADAMEPTPPPTSNYGGAPSAMGSRGGSIDEGTGMPGEKALEGPQRPSLVLQKFAPEEVQVGKECQFVVKVRNVGQRPAENVIVEDEIPAGAKFVGANPQTDASGPTLSWRIGTMSPGEERTIEINLMPTSEGEIGSVAKVTFASQASAKSRCTRPQLALRMTAPSQVLIGRQQPVTIEIHNPGTGDATNVLLLENVPDNVRHQHGPALEFEVGTLRAGETRRMELVLTAEKPGKVVNIVTARADGNLQVQQEVEFEVISPALAVAVDGPSKRYLERQATYTIRVENPGTAPAKDVQLVTKLPKGLQYVSANNLGEYDATTHSVYWSLAELPEGKDGTVELVALPVQSGDHTIEVEGRAREGLEDRTTQPVRVEGLAAIMFEVHDAQDPIEVGGSTSYEIRVVNQGSKAATNVQVTALIAPGMTVTGAQGETRHAVEAEGVVFEPLARLAPKAETIFRVDVQGTRAGDQRVMVEVRTDDIPQPIRKEESTRVFGDE